MTKVWSDNRSGEVGQLAGNIVLDRIRTPNTSVVHRKGTVFDCGNKTYIGRICSSDDYLQGGMVHFCNMNKEQHNTLVEESKSLYYVFITVSKSTIHYWIVPGRVVGEVLKQLPTKPDSTTCFLRITEDSGKYLLANKNITRYHSSVDLGRSAVPRYSGGQNVIKSKIISLDEKRFKDRRAISHKKVVQRRHNLVAV